MGDGDIKGGTKSISCPEKDCSLAKIQAWCERAGESPEIDEIFFKEKIRRKTVERVFYCDFSRKIWGNKEDFLRTTSEEQLYKKNSSKE